MIRKKLVNIFKRNKDIKFKNMNISNFIFEKMNVL